MNEEFFVSGRNIPNVDPYLQLWHWPIPLYLFLGGLAAGIMFFAAYNLIKGKDQERKTTTMFTPFLVPVLLIVGLAALFYDLTNKLYFWQLYTTIRIDSPMSWGAWVLLFITPLSMVWCLSYLDEVKLELQKNENKNKVLIDLSDMVLGIKLIKWVKDLAVKYRLALAWTLAILSVVLGIYTGILLSAFNARPLWNTSILGPLFLASGLSAGAAVNMWLSKDKMERMVFGRIDLLIIVIEIMLIVHMFMGFRASSKVQIDSADLFLGGEFTLIFWGVVVGLGLVVPALLEVLKLKGKKIPVALPAILILIGGIVFRFVMVEAGQLTRYLY
jgi:formate-dependent nitrite reductase membrane component NrfD